MVIGILLRSTAWYTLVKQHRPQLVLGWVTILVCQFLLIVLRMRLGPGAHSAAVPLGKGLTVYYLVFTDRRSCVCAHISLHTLEIPSPVAGDNG